MASKFPSMQRELRLQRGPSTTLDFERVVDEAATVRLHKVRAYGQSRYEDNDVRHAMMLTYGDIHRKYIRIRELILSQKFEGEDGESLRDAFMDIANYGLMGVQLYDQFMVPQLSLMGSGYMPSDYASVKPSEALYAFMAWLTTRPVECGPFGEMHDSSHAPILVDRFCLSQEWPGPDPHYTEKFKPYPYDPRPLLPDNGIPLDTKPVPEAPGESAPDGKSWVQHWHDVAMAKDEQLEEQKALLRKVQSELEQTRQAYVKATEEAEERRQEAVRWASRAKKAEQSLIEQEQPIDTTPRVDQVAIFAKDPVRVKKTLASLFDIVEWHDDQVVAEGEVFRHEAQNFAHLSFNYQLIKHGIEFEVLHYPQKHGGKHNENWLARADHSANVEAGFSHLAMHVDANAMRFFKERAEKLGMQIAQEVYTQSHTNPAIKDSRRYHYVIFSSRSQIGFDLKLIERLPYEPEGVHMPEAPGEQPSLPITVTRPGSSGEGEQGPPAAEDRQGRHHQ